MRLQDRKIMLWLSGIELTFLIWGKVSVTEIFHNFIIPTHIHSLLLYLLHDVLAPIYTFKLGSGQISGLAEFQPDTGYRNHQASYPVLSDIQPYFTEVFRPDICQFSLLYQTKLTLSGRISSQTGYPAQP